MFSVVIPVRNGASTIDVALEDVLGQTRPPIDVIVVDDGSDDDTVIRARRHLGVDVLEIPPTGVGAARNAGISAASAEWVALLDADDRWSPNHLEELARIVTTFPDCVLVSTTHRREPLGRSIDRPVLPGSIRKIDYFMVAGDDIGVVWSSAAALRRQVALGVSGFGSVSHGEDLEMWTRLALVGSVAVSDAVTAIYSMNPRGAMARGTRRSPPPTHLSEVSASLSVVTAALEREGDAARRKSLIYYASRRLATALRHAVVDGDLKMIRSLVRLRPAGAPIGDRTLFFFARVNPKLLCALQRIRVELRSRFGFRSLG